MPMHSGLEQRAFHQILDAFKFVHRNGQIDLRYRRLEQKLMTLFFDRAARATVILSTGIFGELQELLEFRDCKMKTGFLKNKLDFIQNDAFLLAPKKRHPDFVDM